MQWRCGLVSTGSSLLILHRLGNLCGFDEIGSLSPRILPCSAHPSRLPSSTPWLCSYRMSSHLPCSESGFASVSLAQRSDSEVLNLDFGLCLRSSFLCAASEVCHSAMSPVSLAQFCRLVLRYVGSDLVLSDLSPQRMVPSSLHIPLQLSCRLSSLTTHWAVQHLPPAKLCQSPVQAGIGEDDGRGGGAARSHT